MGNEFRRKCSREEMVEGKTDEKTGGLPDPRFHMELWKSVPLCLFVCFVFFLSNISRGQLLG